MAYEHKPNSGTLFDNDRKTKDTQPDLKGTVLIDGKEYWASGWFNEKEGQKRRVSLSFELKEQQSKAPESPTKSWSKPEPKPFTADEKSQEIPF